MSDKPTPELRYGVDDERLDYTSLDDVFDALDREGRFLVDEVYYEADVVPVQNGEFLKVGDVLELADDSLYQEIGECADAEYCGVSKEARSELQALLLAWERKHVELNYLRVVGKVRERRVMSSDGGARP